MNRWTTGVAVGSCLIGTTLDATRGEWSGSLAWVLVALLLVLLHVTLNMANDAAEIARWAMDELDKGNEVAPHDAHGTTEASA